LVSSRLNLLKHSDSVAYESEQAKFFVPEFWIYSVYGNFYLKVVFYARIAVGAENPRNYSYFNLPNYALRKSPQSRSQLSSLAQIFGEEPAHPLLLM
jgi:hypothetical protein